MLDITVQSSEKPTVPELPHMGDPFMEMLYVIHVLMPAILDVKQYDLAELGGTLEDLAVYQNKLSYAQDLFNDFFEDTMVGNPADVANDILNTMRELKELVENGDVLDGDVNDPDSLKGQVVESLGRFIDEATAATPGQPDKYFSGLYANSPTINEYSGDSRIELKKRLDDFNIVGVAFRSTSAQTQTLFDYDTQDYNAWVGLTDSMLKDMINQVGAPIREGLKTA